MEEIIEVQAANFDLVVKARFQNLKQLADFTEGLRYVEGIEEASTAIITEETILPPSNVHRLITPLVERHITADFAELRIILLDNPKNNGHLR